MRRDKRTLNEANRLPRYKSSLAKQFTDEVVSPLKKDHIKLGYSVDGNEDSMISLSANKPVESLRFSDNKRFAAANAGMRYVLSSQKEITEKPNSLNRQSRTIAPSSPVNRAEDRENYGTYANNPIVVKNDRHLKGQNSARQLQETQLAQARTSLDVYGSPPASHYMSKRIPTVS